MIQDRIDDMMPRNYGYLYVIHCAHTGLRKIGVTNNPDSRLAQIQTDCAWPLVIESLFWVYSPVLMLAEKFLHQLFSNCRHHGEWFELNEEEVKFMSSPCVLSFNVVNVSNKDLSIVE